jgi:hypothetical protein
MSELGKGKPGWRGPELIEWSTYIEKGGIICPMSFLDYEGAPIQKGTPFTINDLPLKKQQIQ